MSKLNREHLNKKITLMLTNFESLNGIMKDYDVRFCEYYEELRTNFIKVLNDIVDNYTYKTPGLQDSEGLKEDLEYLREENEALKQELEKIKANAKSSSDLKTSPVHRSKPITPLSKLEAVTKKHEKKTKARSKGEFGNGLLKWSNAKDFNHSLSTLSYRALSVKQLKDLIAELYEAKELYDTGCRKQHQPRETLEQFMYNHLKYKYGLNNLVIEWVFGIIEAVKIFSPMDNDVATFGLVS